MIATDSIVAVYTNAEGIVLVKGKYLTLQKKEVTRHKSDTTAPSFVGF